jgi:undecaprenyl diphosphate synthase
MEALPATYGDLPPPVHIAIIMDGNGRWAQARGLPRIAGHKRGAEAVRKTVEAAAAAGVSYLTLFGFSSENWKRPENEVGDLMGLLRLYLKSEINALKKNGIRLRVIGDRSRFDKDIVAMIERGEEETRDGVRLNLILALSYGGRHEIAVAAQELARQAVEGKVAPDDIDESLFASHLNTADVPDPDLLIRTSGEQRISNFLLWQLAYTELVFTDVLWPDFDEAELAAAIGEFNSRERRYGATVSTA